MAVVFLNVGHGVGGALTLCAVAAAISFISFAFTDYSGLAELGKIAGMGMFVALFANLTVLPALVALMPPGQKPASQNENSNPTNGWVARNARAAV